MKKGKILVSLLLVFTLFLFAGCSDNSHDERNQQGDKNAQATEKKQDDLQSSDEDMNKENLNKNEEKVTLYIGNINAGYNEIQVEMKSEEMYSDKFDEHLIAALEKETGWSMSLAESIEDIEGGKIIQFSDKSGFIIGPPEKQNDKYFVYDNISFAQMMLDSIQKTFDMNLTDRNPQHSLKLYFSINDKPITVENLTIPNDKPWNEGRAVTFQ